MFSSRTAQTRAADREGLPGQETAVRAQHHGGFQKITGARYLRMSFSMGNNDANGEYLTKCAELGLKPHPARFPSVFAGVLHQVPDRAGDLVLRSLRGQQHHRTGR
jgi:hypothetical protein